MIVRLNYYYNTKGAPNTDTRINVQSPVATLFSGDHLLMKTVAETTGRKLDKIKKDVEETGDLGIVAEGLFSICAI